MIAKGQATPEIESNTSAVRDFRDHGRSRRCDSESNEKEDAITSHKRTIGDLEAEIADATARISELGTEVEELAGKISGAESELSEATKLREEEKATFAASESELVDTVDSLERALVVLKRGQTSFLQARDQDTLKKMTMSLSQNFIA